MRSRSVAAAVAGTLVAMSVGLLGGFVLKDRCSTRAWDGVQYRTGCYNDILALYGARGLDREPMPYVRGDGVLAEDEAGDLEYPVGTGLFIGLVAQQVGSGVAFFRVSAAGLAVAGLAAAVLLVLTADDRRRIALFALAPSLVLYAFLNWDLLAVLTVAAAFFAFARGADGVAGAALGIGAATKLFPGIFLPVLVAARWHRRGRLPWGMIGAAAGAFIALNLPVLVLNPEGWWFPWSFQSSRFPNYETGWFFLYRHLDNGDPFWFDVYPRLTSVASLGLFAVGAAVVVALEWRRARFRPAATAFAFVLLFLLTAKVYSPQFALWVLPFFVLVRARWFDYAAFVVADLGVAVTIAAFLLDTGSSVRLGLLEAAVFARYAVLAFLIWRSRALADNLSEEPGAAREDDDAERGDDRHRRDERLV